MKKLNQLAIEDAQRYFNAVGVRDEIYAKVDANPAYHAAIEKELDKLFTSQPTAVVATQDPFVVPVKTGMSRSTKIKTVAVLVVGVAILHETGYDSILWDKAVRWAKRTKKAAEDKKEELKEEHPYAAEAVQNVADTVKTAATDIKDTAKDAYQKETSDTEPTFKPSPGQTGWSGETPRAY